VCNRCGQPATNANRQLQPAMRQPMTFMHAFVMLEGPRLKKRRCLSMASCGGVNATSEASA
jgi:hypothetical protein